MEPIAILAHLAHTLFHGAGRDAGSDVELTMADNVRILKSLTEPLPLWEAVGARVEPAVESDGLTDQRIGLFVDAQNIRLEYLDETISQLGDEGELRIRRAFGHWPEELPPGDAEVHLKHAVELRQCPRLTSLGKNAADIAMVVDVMDVLSRDDVDVFALASSDSDFTPLVQHLKRAGKEVRGFGLANAPESLRAACSRFEEIEVQRLFTEGEDGEDGEDPVVKMLKPEIEAMLRKVVWTVKETRPGGWKALGEIGQVLAEEGLSPKEFGRTSLSRVCEERPEFEVDQLEKDGGWYVRFKERPTKFSKQEEEILKKVMRSIRGDRGWLRIDSLSDALREDDSWEFWKHQGKLKKKLQKLGWLEMSPEDSQLVRMVK